MQQKSSVSQKMIFRIQKVLALDFYTLFQNLKKNNW